MPKIIEITVHSGRVIPHPHQSYANLRPGLSLRVAIQEGEDVEAITTNMQGYAERLLGFHVANLLVNAEDEYQAKLKRQEEEYERRNRERSLAAVADPDELDDEDVDDTKDMEF